MAFETQINSPYAQCFRRAFIKRRSNSTGLYEASWFDITKYVKKFGSLERSIDDVRLNKFIHSGVTLTVRNDSGAFNPEDNPTSLWYTYMTRYRTLLKLEGGYFDSSQNELPTDPSLGVFIMSDEIPISGVSNQASIKARSLISVFDEVRASEIVGITTTQTASDLIAKIRDHTDGSNNFYFRNFITNTSWTIQATTNNYYLGTTTAVGDMSTWEFMEKLAESEGRVILINRTGGIEFKDRTERTTTSQFSFYGQGFREPNIIKLNEFKEAYNKLFTFFRLKYLEPDTSTSYVTAGSTSSVDPSGTSWKYGTRQYNFENTLIANTATAQGIVNTLASEFSVIKDELDIETKFIPHLEILDKVDLSYRSYDAASTVLWNLFNWNEVNWPTETGENFDWDQVAFKVLSIKTNLDNFSTTFQLREI